MVAWRRFLSVLGLVGFGLLPLSAEELDPIGPLKVIHSGEIVTSSARAESLAFFATLAPGRGFSPGFLRSDGTVAGTFSIDPRGPATPGSRAEIRFANSHGPLLFFTCALHASPRDRSLWRSDGTADGTFPVTRGLSLAIDSVSMEPPVSLSVPERGLELFSAGPRANAPDFELWATDGTVEGTRLVRDLNPKGPSNPRQMIALHGWLLFLADTPRGRQVWRSDGTPAGTARVHDVDERRAGAVTLVHAGGALFILENGEAGVEVWRSDGTEAGTDRVLELSRPLHGYRPAGRNLFLVAGDAASRGMEMWAVDGGTGEAVQVLQAPMAPDLHLFDVGDHVAFALRDERGLEPWWSDGTPEGTHRIADVCKGSCDSSPSFAGTYGGRAVFEATDGVSGREPWWTDGTAAGTRQIGDFCTGPCDSTLGRTLERKGWLVLLMSNGSLWTAGGTSRGATRHGNVATPADWILIPAGVILYPAGTATPGL